MTNCTQKAHFDRSDWIKGQLNTCVESKFCITTKTESVITIVKRDAYPLMAVTLGVSLDWHVTQN